jgi:hypothetical protein
MRISTSKPERFAGSMLIMYVIGGAVALCAATVKRSGKRSANTKDRRYILMAV